MSAGGSADFEPLISRNALDEQVHDALRLFVGRGRRYSVKQLAKGAGIPERMIESAIAPLDSTEFRPLARENLWSVIAFLRAPFTNELLALVQQGAFDLPEGDLPPAARMAADCANDTAHVAEIAADQTLTHEDRQTLKLVGQRSVERGMHMIAAASKWIRNHYPHGRKAA